MPRRYRRKNPADHYSQLMPLPVAPILLCPSLIIADGRVYRAALALAFAYWCGGCRGLPDDDASLGEIARLSPQHWGGVRAGVKQVTDELFPALQADFLTMHESRVRQRAAAIYAQSVLQQKRAQSTRSAKPQVPHGQKAPKYHGTGQHDDAARRQSIAREKAATARKGADTARTPLNPGNVPSGRLSDSRAVPGMLQSR